MDNNSYDDQRSKQQIYNKNVINRLEELEDKAANKVNDQLNIKLIKKAEQCSGLASVVTKLDGKILNLLDRLEDLEEFTQTAALEANARFDIGINSRTIAFKKIKALEDFQAQTIKFYSDK